MRISGDSAHQNFELLVVLDTDVGRVCGVAFGLEIDTLMTGLVGAGGTPWYRSVLMRLVSRWAPNGVSP